MNLYIACLDLENKVHIEQVEVKNERDKKYVLTYTLTGIKPISTVHWDAICKSVGKKTIPAKSVGDNWERGYVFYSKIDAIKRLENYVDQMEDKAIQQLEMVASHRARLGRLNE